MIGLAGDSTVVASDVQALVAYTDSVIYLDDFEIAHIQKSDVTLYDDNKKQINMPVNKLDWSTEQERGLFALCSKKYSSSLVPWLMSTVHVRV